MFRALRGIDASLNVLVVGRQGTGKSTYAYYSFKVAYLHNKAYGHIVRARKRIGYSDDVKVEFTGIKEYVNDNNLRVCLHANCDSMDDIDKELHQYMFVDYEDYPRLYDVLISVVKNREPPPFLFLDDMIIKGITTLGGYYRRIYQYMNKLYAFFRAVSRVIIVTAPAKDFVPKTILQSAYRIESYVQSFNTLAYVHYSLMSIPRIIFTGGKAYEYVKKAQKFEWRDEIPKKAIFRMPRWLEVAIDDRKRRILIEDLENLLEMREKETKESGS